MRAALAAQHAPRQMNYQVSAYRSRRDKEIKQTAWTHLVSQLTNQRNTAVNAAEAAFWQARLDKLAGRW